MVLISSCSRNDLKPNIHVQIIVVVMVFKNNSNFVGSTSGVQVNLPGVCCRRHENSASSFLFIKRQDFYKSTVERMENFVFLCFSHLTDGKKVFT